jgi:lipid II:glycine glycyltransferase (peptidoglycan interpeptide bridge formation enzyme)
MKPTLFHQPWWLDIVAPNSWAAAEVLDGGRLVASMPYTVQRRFGLNLIQMPPLTQVLGPIEPTYHGKYASQLARQKDIYDGLIGALPKYDLFRQSFHPGVTNWLPFYWHGFAQSTRYTYRLDLAQTTEALWAGTQDRIRTDIRKAQRELKIREELDPGRFLAVIALTFERQGMRLPYELAMIRRIFERAPIHARIRALAADDERGVTHGVALFVGDENCVYYLLGGADPALRTSGCQSLLLWEGICWAKTFSSIFDFEGSMLEGVERFVRGFGAQQQNYFQLTSMSRRMSTLWHATAMFKSIRGRPTSAFSI